MTLFPLENQQDGTTRSASRSISFDAAVGPHATELIAEATIAIRSELTAEELGRTIHAPPKRKK
jgi:pyruvate/2-oxoglutarate dehydrogenase complex dihydrolipoamide dehydrogenase (E3) component